MLQVFPASLKKKKMSRANNKTPNMKDAAQIVQLQP